MPGGPIGAGGGARCVGNLGVDNLLKQAVWWIDAGHPSAGSQRITNLGWGGQALDAQVGSGPSPDTNDPKQLRFDGRPYIYLPGVDGNNMQVTSTPDFNITSDIDLRRFVAAESWNPSAQQLLLSKWESDGNLSYVFAINTNGTLQFTWAPLGTNASSRLAISTIPVPFAAGTAVYLRCNLDVDNGAGGWSLTFLYSFDGVAWVQLGATVTGVGATSIFNGTNKIVIGAYGWGARAFAGKDYRTQILNGIDGPTVLDVDTSVITTGAATSFTALTGQGVLISRALSGRKAVAVVRSCLLFGADDFLEVGDNVLLDFAAADPFTIVFVARRWATPTSYAKMLTKRAGAGAGWSLETETTNNVPLFLVADGTNTSLTYSAAAEASGSLGVWAGMRDTGTDKLYWASGATISLGTTDTTVGSLANGDTLRVGSRSSGSYFADMEFFQAALFRFRLTATEFAAIANEMQRWYQ